MYCIRVCVCVRVRAHVSPPHPPPDGLMVQITPETMAELRRSLREMKDYAVNCGRVDRADSQEELVCVQWVEAKCALNKGWGASSWLEFITLDPNLNSCTG